MIKIPKDRTFRELLERHTGKKVLLHLGAKKIHVTIISLGADCIQVDKLGKNFIPISAISMLSV